MPSIDANLRPQLHKGVEGLFYFLQEIKEKTTRENPEKENEREESG